MKDIRNAYARLRENKGFPWPKDADPFSKWQISSLLIATVLVIIGGLSNFIPSTDFYEISIYLSLPISLLLTVPTTVLLFKDKLLVYISMPRLLPNTRNKVIFVVLISLLFWFMAHIAIADGAGFLLHKMNSSNFNGKHIVTEIKKEGRRGRAFACRYTATLKKYIERDVLNTVCIDYLLFTSLKKNDQININGTKSFFGIHIEYVEKDNNAFNQAGQARLGLSTTTRFQARLI